MLYFRFCPVPTATPSSVGAQASHAAVYWPPIIRPLTAIPRHHHPPLLALPLIWCGKVKTLTSLGACMGCAELKQS